MNIKQKHLHNQLANHLIKIVFALLLTFILTLLIEWQAGHLFKSVPQYFQNQVQTLGALSLLLFLLFYLLANLLLIPTTPFIFLAGIAYPFYIAFPLILIAILLAATSDFFLARNINAKLPLHVLHTQNIEKFKQHVNGFIRIFLLRYIGIHFSVVSYAAGITKLTYKKFILATLSGSLLYILIYLYAGISLSNLASITFIYRLLLLKVCLITSFIILYVFARKKRKL